MHKSKTMDSKKACYSSLTVLYQQLGSEWKDILLSGSPRQSKKYVLIKKFDVIQNPCTYKQLRCTKKEPISKDKETEKKINKHCFYC